MADDSNSLRRSGGSPVIFWRNPFVIFLSGQVIMFMFWVGGASYFSGQFTQKFANLEVRMAAIESRAERMDAGGTNASRLAVTLDQNRLNELESRMKYNDEIARKLPVIEAAVNRIESDVKELKSIKK